MYPASFEYHRASSVSDALALMEKYGDDAKLLAGGHSLLPIMKLRFASPAHLIDIGRVSTLRGITESGGTLTIGALTKHAELEAYARKQKGLAAWADAAAVIGDVQIRNRGTIGGSIAHADPGADFPGVLLAFGGDVVVTGKGGERTIAADDVFVGYCLTSLGAGELITQVRLKVPGVGTGSAYVKHPDAASGYALVGIAAVVTTAGGKITAARVAMTGMGPKATRLTAVEAALTGQAASAATVGAASKHAAKGLDLFDDARGTAAYKANLAATYVARAVTAAISRA